jgi:uncharacterized protein YcfJ
MRKSPQIFVLVALASAASLSFAQEVGRVISSTPVVSQVAVPRQVCSQQQVQVQGQKSGGGALMGAVAGGAIGNSLGGGEGKAIATFIGLIGGAMLGDRIEGGGAPQTQNVQNCTTQSFYENRTTAYNVVYDFNGRQYSVQMPQDPGPTVRLQVTPVGGTALPQPGNLTELQQDGVPVYSQQNPVYSQPAPPQVVTQVVQPPVYVAVPPPVYPTVVYTRPYYPPVGVSLNFGWSNWNGQRGHGHNVHRGHHGNWR